jgi:hypothetical protein
MVKTKLKRFHKIKIHHNRWLAWAIAYALMITIAVTGYIKVSDVVFESQIAADNEFVAWRSYIDNRLGFSVRYPASWGIEADEESGISFLPLDITEEGISVRSLALSEEADLRSSFDIVAEKRIKVDGIQGTELTNDLGNRVLETIILVEHNNRLVAIFGPVDMVYKFLVTFQFLN